MSAFNIAKIVQLAGEAGIAPEVFDGWEGRELALYRDLTARSADPAIATRIASEKLARELWVLDLGHKATGVSKTQGRAFQVKLDESGIRYASGPVGDVYFKRIQRVTRE